MLSRLTFIAVLSAAPLLADDWPAFRGPTHDGRSRETGLAFSANPKILWRANVGLGFSTFVAAGDRVLTAGHDGKKNGTATVWCFDAATGRVVWQHSYPAPLGDKYFEGGTTGTPTIHDGKVFHLSREGDCFCLDLATGKILWQRQLVKDLGVEIPDWGFASSPLVEDGRVFLNLGPAGTALDAGTGQLAWQSGGGMAGYATCVGFDLAGTRCLAILSKRECVVVEAATGKIRWRVKFTSAYDTNAGAPVIHDGAIFISGEGSPGVRLNARDGTPVAGWKTETIVNLNAGVALDGHLYAFHGHAGKSGAQLRCLDWKTGATKWAQDGLGVGSLLVADGKLICLSEKGELVIAAATPEKFTPLARAQLLGGKCWTAPALAHGRLFVRNVKGDLLCVEAKSQ
ncbi:MAG: PQQ-binding-like beta-propeller repeat protein [Verrucomicrobia bacterium]|nr:PQQ-binding-like beta-propeller repeat protein [Verrucomicrobiota bacterium]